MVKKHLKRLNAPITWQIEKKAGKFITKAKPGAHSFKHSMPLNLVLKDLIKCAKTRKEIKIILNNKNILVDGKRRKDPRLCVGFMDVIEIKESGELFRMMLNKKGKITAVPIEKKDAGSKICKIKNKTMTKKGMQLNLFDNKNIIVEKNNYKVGDSILIELAGQKIIDHLKLEKGANIFLVGGKHIGKNGVIENIEGGKIFFKDSEGKSCETLKEFAYVIGKEKPLIEIK